MEYWLTGTSTCWLPFKFCSAFSLFLLTISIHLIDHVLQLSLGGVLSQRAHHCPELLGGDGSITILVKERERLLELCTYTEIAQSVTMTEKGKYQNKNTTCQLLDWSPFINTAGEAWKRTHMVIKLWTLISNSVLYWVWWEYYGYLNCRKNWNCFSNLIF